MDLEERTANAPVLEQPKIEVYSEKLGGYITIEKKPKGELQIYNVGLGPGNWY
ncbi:MAG: hypothetical protein ABIJ21_00730 [Nanoarchaeota archaeon]